jgi:hypothetical protein
MTIVRSAPRRLRSVTSRWYFVLIALLLSLGAACARADAESPATRPSSRPGAPTLESISCRTELESSRGPFEAHGLFRPGQVHSVRRKPATVPLRGIRIPYRIRVLRQLDVGAGPQDHNGYLMNRVMPHFDLHVGKDLRLFSEFEFDPSPIGMVAHDPESTKSQATFIRPSLRSDLMSAVHTG